MKVLVIGANGQVARHTLTKLKEEGHQIVAMIRDSAQAKELLNLGADETIVADLETNFDHAFQEINAVIFAAGSGGHTGADKTILIDLWGAIKAVNTAERLGVKRFIMLSSMGTVDPVKSERIKHYLVAKKLADDHLKRSSLTYTIVRPGSLTNDQAQKMIKLEEEIQVRDTTITREDVAIVLAKVVNLENTFGKTFEILNGHDSIDDALNQL